ncbi:MAG: hypothetical protein PUD71_07485 [Lachnospiraceae bacterium]|nr:hypothetical protein [Lachnospiraceae bacterium]MDD6858203.1 hypothetical protein [Lachnospiraceae bacterium]
MSRFGKLNERQIKYGFDYLHKDEPHPKMVVEVMVIMYSVLFILRIAAFVFSYC